MSSKIKIPLEIWPNHKTNANGVIRPVGMTNNQFVPRAAVLPTASVVDYSFVTVERIQDVHATPNGKIGAVWFTLDSNTTSTLRIIAKVSDIEVNVTDPDITSWDDTINLDDISNGARKWNYVEASLSSTTLSDGRLVAGILRRDYTGEATDDLNAECYLVAAWLIADEA